MTISQQLKDFWRRHVISDEICELDDVDIELPSDDEFETTRPFIVLIEELKP